MLRMKYLFYFILLHINNCTPKFNLYYTNWVSESENDINNFQHDCLRVADPYSYEVYNTRALASYCMGELPSKFTIEINGLFQKFTFAQLSKQNISSEQLYIWSAPIDIIERYQFYLDQSSHDRNISIDVFYNCTLPRFGPMCQYQLETYYSKDYSLYQIIHNFYKNYEYHPTNLTCYTHLQCDRGNFPSCLDWTEICDGVIDCLNGGLDEKDCWQLEINECNEDEFRCSNGLCIPQSFYGDLEQDNYDCIDGSDYADANHIANHKCSFTISFRCEDISCLREGLTSSCTFQRQHLLIQAMFSSKDKLTTDECWSAFKCVMYIYKDDDLTCNNICNGSECIKIIERTCPDTMFIPTVPVLFGHIYFVYQKNATEIFLYGRLQYLYICYNNSYYNDYFAADPKILINNIPCYHHKNDPDFSQSNHISQPPHMFDIYEELWGYYQVFNYTSTFCKRPNMYQCINSIKCVAIHRLNNRINDCPQGDDEDSLYPLGSFNNFSNEYDNNIIKYIRMNISFQTICNGYTELYPIGIEGRNETDETECQQWECSNIYTRCNHFWNCLNGEDELNCDLPPKLDCPLNNHICVSSDTNELMCLSIEKANNGIVDCLGGTDEPILCRKEYETTYPDNFYCIKHNFTMCINGEELCNNNAECDYGDDENFCEGTSSGEIVVDFCNYKHTHEQTDVEKVLCKSLRQRMWHDPLIVYFTLIKPEDPYVPPIETIENKALLGSFIIEMPRQYQPRCHRGLDLRVWLNDTNYSSACLCPPNFYGDTCQYQNQRVILSVKFRAMPDSWETFFAIVIFLIDDNDQQIIHSYEQFTYLSVRDCRNKFNVYLLYSMRPKNQTKNYAIHVDIYEKFSLTFRGSLLFPINFSFLPVHRLSFIVDIPRKNDNFEKCSDHKCIYGKCMRYFNNRSITFCYCNKGWTGRYCNIPYNCTCSSDSLCIGISADKRSICVCRPNKFGPQCLMNTACQINDNSICKNNGLCISPDEYIGYEQHLKCVCPKGFTGNYCQFKEDSLLLSFENDIILSQSIFMHFILTDWGDFPKRITTFVTIPIKQDSLTVYWSQPFDISFIEVFMNKYYLIIARNQSFSEEPMINKTIKSSDRCPHINEIFNQTILKWHLLRQIKYYHLICQNYSANFTCFYDNIHFCLCYDFEGKRLANCFEFHHDMTMDCSGTSDCENGGRCFQDKPDCPQRSMCLCQACFFGRLCQFRTDGFGLSLDAILGYHIQRQTSITHQPIIVKTSVALTIIFIVAGIINSLLSIITFKNKSIQTVGCGIYLLSSSITALLITILFGLKFWILILSQVEDVSNRLFLSLQCYSLDFLLRICLNVEQWLNAFVAVERAYTVIQGAGFNKKKSKKIAKLVIVIILIVNICTSIHDPIHRKVIEEENDDDNEKRIWCIATYSHSIRVFNSVMHILHFFGPFLINLVSSITLIVMKAHRQLKLHTQQTFSHHLQEQFKEHKHLLTAPMLLVTLAIPRLIISFVSKCMKSANDSAWLFLVGYFISFIPSMLTFVIFILSSTFYKKEFHKTVNRCKQTLQRRLHRSIS
ncbi:unnamed protein product [Adineta steineri]|uniref:Uncharacterized protein n=1 Tax=Adineta steineri TaxID=433720 RepID=A0A815Z1I5_9BILA|nr:unnamed protein product [Adineta steineri]CAF1576806.1 unnamed protein product [Adineta steineri]